MRSGEYDTEGERISYLIERNKKAGKEERREWESGACLVIVLLSYNSPPCLFALTSSLSSCPSPPTPPSLPSTLLPSPSSPALCLVLSSPLPYVVPSSPFPPSLSTNRD